MATPTVNDTVKVESQAQAAAPVFTDRERNPSDWDITQTEDGMRFVHVVSGKVFEGTMEDFNKALRGK